MKSMCTIFLRTRRAAAAMRTDCRGIAATEFAVIVPVMLLIFFGTIEITSALTAYRKVTLVARTLSDLTSQSQASVDDTEMGNFFAASSGILWPYSVTSTNTKSTISEVYVDASKVAKIQWSKSATIDTVSGSTQVTLKNSSRAKGDTVTLPPTLLVPETYVIWSEVDYKYLPTVGYVMSKVLGVNLQDQAFTRPRLTKCVDYPKVASPCTPAT